MSHEQPPIHLKNSVEIGFSASKHGKTLQNSDVNHCREYVFMTDFVDTVNLCQKAVTRSWNGCTFVSETDKDLPFTSIYGHGRKQKLAILSSCVFLQPTHQPCSIILRIWSQKCWEHNPAENGLGANAHQGSNHHKESGCHTKTTQAQHKDSILGICKSWQGMKFMKSKQNLPKSNKSVSLRSPFCCEKIFSSAYRA